MKRSEIETGKEYAVRSGAKISRARVGSVSRSGAVCIYDYKGVQCTSELPLRQILMPWPEYEAQQKAKAERDRAVQEERERHAQLVEAQIDEQWAFNLQLQELRGELAARGVGDYKHSSHGVTLSWADLAKVLGMKAP